MFEPHTTLCQCLWRFTVFWIIQLCPFGLEVFEECRTPIRLQTVKHLKCLETKDLQASGALKTLFGVGLAIL